MAILNIGSGLNLDISGNGSNITAYITSSNNSDVFTDFGQNIVNYKNNNFSQTYNITQTGIGATLAPYFTSISSSGSGQYQLITTNNNTSTISSNNIILTSSNYGLGWTGQIPDATIDYKINYSSSAVSTSGQYQLLTIKGVSYTNPNIYLSSNYGNTFTGIGGAILPPAGTDYTSCSISASGQYQLVTSSASNSPAYNYGAYLSDNFGSTSPQSWTAVTSIPRVSINTYTSCSVSGSGQYQIIGANNSPYLYTSYNFGTSFSDVSGIVLAGPVLSTSISASGQYQFVGTSLGCYLSVDYGNNWSYIVDSKLSRARNFPSVSMSASGQYIGAIQKYSGGTFNIKLSSDFGNSFDTNSSLDFIPDPNTTGTAISISPYGQNITVISEDSFDNTIINNRVYVWNQAANYSNLPNAIDISNSTIKGSSNTLFGSGALPRYLGYTGITSTSQYNTAFGYNTLNGVTGGTYNTALGANAYSTGNYSYSTAIGYNTVVTGNNQVVIGTSAETISIPGTINCSSITVGPGLIYANGGITALGITVGTNGITTIGLITANGGITSTTYNGGSRTSGNISVEGITLGANGITGGSRTSGIISVQGITVGTAGISGGATSQGIVSLYEIAVGTGGINSQRYFGGDTTNSNISVKLLNVGVEGITSSGGITAATYNGGTSTSGSISLQGITVGANGITAATYNGGTSTSGSISVQGITVGANGITSSGGITAANYNGGTTATGSISLYSLNVGLGGITTSGTLSANSFSVNNLTVTNGITVGSGGITTSGNMTAVSFITTSDYRVKDNIQPLDESYNVDYLNAVTYVNKIVQKQDIGLIAHELKEHYPCLVNGEKDGESMQSVNYTGIIPILINEVQRLKKRVDILEKK